MATTKEQAITQMHVIFDAETGETTERPLTSKEIAQRETMVADYKAQQTQQEAKTATRLSALAKLGLTEQEIAAL